MVAHTTIAAPGPIETLLSLPAPPSVNRVWAPKIGEPSFYRTKAYRAWIRESDGVVMMQGGVKTLAKMPGRFSLTVTLDEKLVNIDLDNCFKALADYCKRIGLIQDDGKKFMREINARWGSAPLGCTLILRSLP